MSGMVQNKAPPLGRKPICPVLDAMCVPLSVQLNGFNKTGFGVSFVLLEKLDLEALFSNFIKQKL